jgi:hypothetical protein
VGQILGSVPRDLPRVHTTVGPYRQRVVPVARIGAADATGGFHGRPAEQQQGLQAIAAMSARISFRPVLRHNDGLIPQLPAWDYTPGSPRPSDNDVSGRPGPIFTQDGPSGTAKARDYTQHCGVPSSPARQRRSHLTGQAGRGCRASAQDADPQLQVLPHELCALGPRPGDMRVTVP